MFFSVEPWNYNLYSLIFKIKLLKNICISWPNSTFGPFTDIVENKIYQKRLSSHIHTDHM